MSILDTIASRAVMSARVFERAVHDSGPWYVEYDGTFFDAECKREETYVTFTADLPIGLSDGPTLRIALYCRDELVAAREIEVGFLGESGIVLNWEMGNLAQVV